MSQERILILAPVGRDGPLAEQALRKAGFEAQSCRDMDGLCRELAAGAGAAVLTEEALAGPAGARLEEALTQQPPWSDLPLIVFGSRDLVGSAAVNLTQLDRPVRMRTLLSATRTALRARRRQYQVRDLLAQSAQSLQDRDQFLAMLGHELRNPLAALLTASQLIDRAAGDQFLRERGVLGRQLHHLARLVDDLLDVSRVTRGKIPMKAEPQDLRAFVARVVQEFQERARAPGVSLSLLPAEGEVPVRADAIRLEQVITNLLSNAVKYTNKGGRVTVAVETDERAAILRVSDTGVGISAEMLPRIFDLFTQAPGALDRAPGGMGIGLTLVQRLVALHGGAVEAHSQGLGKGSEFVVRLPLRGSVQETVAAEPVQATPPGRALRVLVAEDNDDARDLLQMALEQMGHSVGPCEDGTSAIDRALAEKPDAMLVDLGLPGKNGYEVAQAVRGALGREVRLVALTGYGQADDRARALAAGFDEFLVKPAEIEAVDRALRRA